MTRKILSAVLIVLVVNLAGARPAATKSKEEERARFAEKVKASVAKLGVGREARVEVKLRDKSRLKGYIGEAGDGHFVVVDSETGVATAVAYPQVAKVKGNNLSTGVKFAITVALFVFLLAMLARNDT